MRNIGSLKVGTAVVAILIPEVCRFIAAYNGTTKSDELFENYFGLNPVGICNTLHKSIKAGNHFNARDVSEFSLCFALGVATPVACYFAITKPKSITTIAPAILLCAVQSGLTYNWSRE